MNKKTKWAVFIVLTLALAVGIGSVVAFAVGIPITPVDPSETLEVWVRTSSGAELLYTYSQAEMTALADGYDIEYSSIDSGNFAEKTVATGVYIEDLLDDVQVKAGEKYPGIDIWDFSKLYFIATDGASCSFTYNELFGIDRYYFPGLHEDGCGVIEGEIPYEVGEGEPVEPMLSMTAVQERLPVPPKDARGVYYPEQYTVLFGMSMAELNNVTQRTGDYKRGVYKLNIDMRSYSAPVTGISLDRSAASVSVGKKLQLTATITPSTANKKVTWTSSDTDVATVSSSGMVTAVAAGTTTVTATSQGDSSFSASCTVRVSDPASGGSDDAIDVTAVRLDKTQLTLAVGKESTLTATVSPANATDYTLAWKSSDTAVATVNSNGLVKGVKEGGATITVTAGKYGATCAVTVSNATVAVTGVTLNRTALFLANGKQFQLAATVSPDAATNTTVLWSTDTPGVVSVDTNGMLTAKNIGSAVVSAVTQDGNFSAKCTVTVGDSAFSDISASWAKTDIEKLTNLGLISGYDDGSFHPGATITRAEFLSMLIRALEKTKNVTLQSGNGFSDTASHWAKDYISTAVALKITNGYADNKFGPNDAITREQIAVMLAKAAGYDETQTAAGFTDSGKISSWASPSVAYAVNQGFFSGYADGSFGPAKNATRAEVAAILMRFYEKSNTNL